MVGFSKEILVIVTKKKIYYIPELKFTMDNLDRKAFPINPAFSIIAKSIQLALPLLPTQIANFLSSL